MKWKFMEKTIQIKKKGKIVKTKVKIKDKQIDEVGNVLQKNGGIEPKACQKCKKKFVQKITSVEKKSKIPTYKCTECNFIKPSPDQALDHMIITKHTLKKSTIDVITGIDRIIKGKLIPHIKFIKKGSKIIEVLILCRGCSDGKLES